MRSRTSFFSPGAARKALTRYWPVWGTYLAAWLLMMPTALPSERYYGELADVSVRCDGIVLGFTGMPATIAVAVFSIFSAMAVWSYLFNPRAATFYHALPVRREGLFLTQYLTGLGFLVGPACVTALITFLTELGLGYSGGGRYILEWLAVMLLLSLFFFSLATLCAFLTGHAVALPILYVLLNFAVIVVEYLLRNAVGSFVPSISAGSPRLMALSPIVMLLYYHRSYDYGDTAVHYDGFGYLGWLALAALVLAACALLLYRRRHIESAGDVIAVPFLRPVFRYVFALGCAVVLGSVFYVLLGSESRPLYIGCMLAGGAIGYLAAEMLLKKRFRVLRGCWKGFCVLLAVVLALSLGVTYDLFGIGRWVPAADDVSYVLLNDTRFDDAEDVARVVAMHRMAIAEEGEDDGDGGYVDLVYVMKDGRFVRRWYRVGDSADDRDNPHTALGMCTAILNSESVALRRVLPPEGTSVLYITVSQDERSYTGVIGTGDYEAFYDAVRRDVEAGTLGQWEGRGWDASSDRRAEVKIEFRYSDGNSGALRYSIGPENVYLTEFLENNGYWEF